MITCNLMEILEYSPSFLKIFSHFVSRNYRGKLAPEFRCRFAKRAVEREASRKQGKKGGLFMLIRRLVVEAVHMDACHRWRVVRWGKIV